MTFETTAIIGSTFGGYQFKIRHKDSEVLKRVKQELVRDETPEDAQRILDRARELQVEMAKQKD